MFKFSLGSFGAFPIFGGPYVSKSSGHGAKWSKRSASEVVFSACRMLIIIKCSRSVLVIQCISDFWRPCIYLWLKYAGFFVLLSLYITAILLTSKWPSRTSKSLGLLFAFHAEVAQDGVCWHTRKHPPHSVLGWAFTNSGNIVYPSGTRCCT